MKITLEVQLDEKDEPKYVLRAASLLALYVQGLRDEAWQRGSVISRVGQGVSVGSESVTCISIDTSEHKGD